jgi:hypothetical protein
VTWDSVWQSPWAATGPWGETFNNGSTVDPASLSPALWFDDFSDFSRLFKDSAGTDPVTAYNDFAGLVLDQSQPATELMYCGNTSNYLTVPGGGFNTGSTWTIEAWCYTANVTGSTATLLNSVGRKLYISFAGNRLFVGDGAVNTINVVNSRPTAELFHIAVVKNGSSYQVYLNGVAHGAASTTALAAAVITTWQIGVDTATSSNGLYTRDLRIVEGTAVYTSNFTPPTTLTAISGTKLLTLQGNTFVDTSGNNHTITEVGSPEMVLVAVDGNHASQPTSTSRPTVKAGDYLLFDGLDDRLLVTMPATTGTMVVASEWGTVAYPVSIPAGSFAVGTNAVDNAFSPYRQLEGMFISDGALSPAEIASMYAYYGQTYSGATAYTGCTTLENKWRLNTSLTGPFPMINTSSVTNMSFAWSECSNLTGPFPLLDTSATTNMYSAWQRCTNLTGPFPLLDTSSVTNMSYAWFVCTSLSGQFPLLDTSSVTNFYLAWGACTGLTGNFPLIDLSAATNMGLAWYGCTGIQFQAGMFAGSPCVDYTQAFNDMALTQTSVDNILVSINVARAAFSLVNGTINITGGTSATPGAAGLAAKADLVADGWAVTHN